MSHDPELEASAYFDGDCTCQHDAEEHGWGWCGVDDCWCDAGWCE